MKKNKGISLIALVVTIVVMIILAGVSIFYGTRENITTAYETDMYTEILNVSDAAYQRSITNRLDSVRYPFVGTPLTDATPQIVNNVSYGDGWYLLKVADHIELGLENVENEYIVNYLTGEVVSVKPIIYDDEEYYTSNEIKHIIGDEETPVSDDLYDVAKGVNKPILLTGMIPVRNANGKWLVTNESDERWYDYSAENKVWANVMLYDEITISGYTNEDVRNASLAELDGREVETYGSMFVWLPRHTSNGTSVAYSKLLDDYTQDGYSLSSSFTKDSKPVTGIWISKYDSDYNN